MSLSNGEISNRLIGKKNKKQNDNNTIRRYKSKKSGITIINKLYNEIIKGNSINDDTINDNIRPAISKNQIHNTHYQTPPPPPPPPPPQSDINTPIWTGRAPKKAPLEKSQEQIIEDELRKKKENHQKALFEKIEARRLKLEGSGFGDLSGTTTIRQLYINKYSNVNNRNPNKDTLLNRTIKKYIVITPTQQILTEITNKEINTNENMKANIASIPQAPYIAPPPAPPNQIPKSYPQLVPETLSRPEIALLEEVRQEPESISRPEMNILEQIIQGKTLRKKGYQIPQIEQDPNGTHNYVMEKLKGIRQNVELEYEEPDEDWIGEGFIQDKRNQNVLNMYRRQLVYGF